MKKNIKKWFALTIVGALLVGALSGCGNASANSDNSDGSVEKVIIGTQEMPNDEGIAKALDYFSDEMGVDVEIKQFDSGNDVNTALASGSIDFGLVGSCPASLAISQDLGVKCIWIHEVLGSIESLVARKEANIKSIGDLKGKVVATPFASTAHFSLLQALKEAGLSENDIKLLDMQPSEIYAAWQNGQIDATYVWDPTLSQLENKVVICTSEDMAEASYMTSNVELVRTDFMEKNPELVEAYVRALGKAVDMYQNNTDEAVATIAKALNISEADAKSQMTGSIWLNENEQLGEEYFGTSDSKGNIVQNFYDTAVFLKSQGSITEVPDISAFEEAIDPSAIEAALK